MPTPWIRSVRQSKTLSVYLDPALSKSNWSRTFTSAITQFNQLSQRYQLGVTLNTARDNTANICVNTANGTTSFRYDGGSHTITVPGRALTGHTSNLSRDGKLFKSYVFVPGQPSVNTPRGQRLVGEGVKLVIAVHEFIHCCGLSNNEHSSDDIFTGYPSVDYGSTAATDKVEIQSGGRRHRAPPLFLGNTTISRVQGLWNP